MEQVDITIVGAGVVGLAVAAEVTKNDRTVFVIERHDSFGRETSSRNSEVIHAGIYYPTGTLKAKTCVEGNRLLYKICGENNILHKKTGKLIVATDDSEVPQLEKIFKNGLANGLSDLRMLSKVEIKQLEPNVQAITAIYSPSTGIVDSHRLMEYYLTKAKSNGADIVFNSELKGIEKTAEGYRVVIKDADGEDFSFLTRIFINSAGLESDTIAAMVGIDVKEANYQLNYSKGQYFRLYNPQKWSLSHLIYPVPEPKGAGLGIHVTLDLGEGVRLGPDAKYVLRERFNYDVDISRKNDFWESVKKFLPSVELEDLYPDIAGIRPQLKGPEEDFRDFVMKDEGDKGFKGFINLVGIESPGLTATPAIAKYVEKIVDRVYT
ncbi:MAG: NAD(P)/FAD-dependent oxidoreductase [bacterium]